MKLQQIELVKNMKIGKLHTENKFDEGMLNYAKEKLNERNVAFYYKLSCIFSLTSLSHAAFRLIQRCFTTVARTQNFHQLDFDHVIKILKSSQLHIASELEVFDAAENWISRNNGKGK